MSSQRVFASPRGNTLSHLAYRTFLKTTSSSLAWYSKLFSVSVTSYFPTLISIVKVPADFMCHNLFMYYFFKKMFFPWASRAVFSLLPIKYVCLRVAEVIIDHSEEFCKLMTGFVTWSCCFSSLAGQIGNSPKSLSSGFFWLWFSLVLWTTFCCAFLHLYDFGECCMASNSPSIAFFLMYIEKQATHLQVSLWFFFMKPQESWLEMRNKCLLNPKALLSSKKCGGLNSLMVNF